MENACDLADWAEHSNGYFGTAAMRPPGAALACIMWSLRNFEAGDPRDHVYAVLGLCEAYSKTRVDIVPDYSADGMNAFRKATKFIIQNDGDLLIFRDICRRLDEVHEPTFTSWVPRYDRKRDNSREPYRLIAVGQKAAGDEPSCVQLDGIPLVEDCSGSPGRRCVLVNAVHIWISTGVTSSTPQFTFGHPQAKMSLDMCALPMRPARFASGDYVLHITLAVGELLARCLPVRSKRVQTRRLSPACKRIWHRGTRRSVS